MPRVPRDGAKVDNIRYYYIICTQPFDSSKVLNTLFPSLLFTSHTAFEGGGVGAVNVYDFPQERRSLTPIQYR